jgi:hypothetical protein
LRCVGMVFLFEKIAFLEFSDRHFVVFVIFRKYLVILG